MKKLLVEKTRDKAGRNPARTCGIIDSQSVKTTSASENRGYDGGKKIKGRKRHIVVDALGCLLAITVHAANILNTSRLNFRFCAAVGASHHGSRIFMKTEIQMRTLIRHEIGNSTREKSVWKMPIQPALLCRLWLS